MTAFAVTRTNWAPDVPKEKQTCAWRLFHIHHPCMVPQVFTMNRQIMENWGVPTTGDEKLDRDMRTEWVSVNLTPVQMVEFMDKGSPIMFQDHDVATRVYLDLLGHLRAWNHIFDINLNLRKAPLNDLAKFDELCAMIFPYANPRLMRNEDDAGYGAFLARRSRRALGSVAMAQHTRTLSEGEQPMQYESLSARIAERLAKRLKELGT
jgi:hypothetical protein